MIKKLSKHGNSLALIIDKPILELLNMNEESALKIQVEGHRLIIEAVDSAKPVISDNPKIQAAFEEVMKKYAEDFKKLAKN